MTTTSNVPSIKGSAFSNIAASVLGLVSGGRITRDQLIQRLEPGDMEVIEGTILVNRWYDIRLHVRLLETLRDVGGVDYLRSSIEASTNRLLEGGLYQQLSYLGRTRVQKEKEPHARFLAFGHDLRMIKTLSAAMFNFSRWEVIQDPDHEDRYLIEISDASAFRDVHLFVIQAFVNQITSGLAGANLWSWQRSGPGRVVFRMTRSI